MGEAHPEQATQPPSPEGAELACDGHCQNSPNLSEMGAWDIAPSKANGESSIKTIICIFLFVTN